MKLLLTFFLSTLSLSVPLFVKAQPPQANDIKKQVWRILKLHTQVTDTATINHINTVAENHFESYPDSTIYYAGIGLRFSKAINYPLGNANARLQLAIALTFNSDYSQAALQLDSAAIIYRHLKNIYGVSECLINLGRIKDFLGNYNEAIKLLNQALSLRKATGNEQNIADCYAIMGITFDNKGEFAQALDCYFKALGTDLKYHNELAAADNYCNIGVVMQHLELYPKAIGYSEKALKIWEKLSDRQGISTATINIGEMELSQGNYKRAFALFKKASLIFHQMDDKEGISLIYTDFGLYYYYTHKPDSAVKYMHMALRSAEKYQIKYNKTLAYLALAKIYNYTHNYARAYFYGAQAQATATRLGSINNRAEAALQLSEALAGLKQFSRAYKQHKQYTALTNSLKNNESVQKLTSYNLELDFKNKQAKLLAVTKQKEQRYKQKIKAQQQTGLVFAAVLITLALLALLYYKQKRKQEQLNAELNDKNKEILQQKASLDQTNSLKNRLIAILAHDLRAPLSTLRGMFALLKDENITETEFFTMLPLAASKLDNTADFLDTLLFWINSQVENEWGDNTPYLLENQVARELGYIDGMAKSKGISVNMHIPANTWVKADANSVRVVIYNLLVNAIKFSYPNSVIEIDAKHLNNQVVQISITDHGTGMTADQLQQLFKGKAKSTPGTDSETGTGMGLFFCRDLVEKNNGAIWAESKIGEGTVVNFTLPAASAP